MTLTVSASVSYDPVPAVSLSVVSSPAVLAEVVVWRVHPSGERFRVLTNPGANVMSGSWVGLDYHFPFNAVFTYVAEAAGQTSAESAPVFFPCGTNWLTGPSGDGVSAAFFVGPAQALSRKARTQRFDVLGRTRPVFQTVGRRSGVSGELTVHCDSLEETRELRALLDDGGPLLIRTRWSDPDLSWAWVQPGDETTKSPSGRLAADQRHVSFSFEECEQPDFDTTPVWTIGDLAAEGLTIGQVASTFASVGALTLNVRS